MRHGGILAGPRDKAMSWVITHAGDLGVTARITLTFRLPAHVGDELLLVADRPTRHARVGCTSGGARYSRLSRAGSGVVCGSPERGRRQVECGLTVAWRCMPDRAQS